MKRGRDWVMSQRKSPMVMETLEHGGVAADHVQLSASTR